MSTGELHERQVKFGSEGQPSIYSSNEIYIKYLIFISLPNIARRRGYSSDSDSQMNKYSTRDSEAAACDLLEVDYMSRDI